MQTAVKLTECNRRVGLAALIAVASLLKLPEPAHATFQLPIPSECLYEQRNSETQNIFDKYTGSMYSEQSDLELVREQFDWENGHPEPLSTLTFSLTKNQNDDGIPAGFK